MTNIKYIMKIKNNNKKIIKIIIFKILIVINKKNKFNNKFQK